MSSLRRRSGVDIVSGPLMKNIFLFAVPIILSGVLQMLFNAADTAVVGRFGSPTALASVGSTGSLTHLIINAFLGMSVGAGVAVAQGIGAERTQEVRETVRTSVTLSLICGVIVGFIGYMFSPVFLSWMGSPADVIDGAAQYMRTYFLGMPAVMLFNFGSSILRSMGDTRRPLYFLLASGGVNVVLNLIFVIPLHMDVVGVALATVISQCGAAVLVMLCLLRLPEDVRLDLRRLGVNGQCLAKIVRIGLPAGLQSCLFSFSNVILQSSVNSLGSAAVSANAAVTNLDNIIYIAMNGVSQSATTFAGQNYGARNIRRVRRTMMDSSALTAVLGAGMGGLCWLLADPLLGLFTADAQVIEIAKGRMAVTLATYMLCGLMEIFSSTLRGMGRSVLPMVVSLLGVCGVRLSWIFFYFPTHRTLAQLYISYPLSWLATAAVQLIFCLIVLKKEQNHVDSDLSRVRGESVCAGE
ncbi:MAG: MATE family efflux transporter [Oscillospiraceae bacterium]|nr:MATE family efflux transporter [Oscillospiraceae bacterium]